LLKTQSEQLREKAQNRGRRDRSTEAAEGTTPVAIERVWKLLRIGGIATRRCAKECVTA
jgi:hypothetical protein